MLYPVSEVRNFVTGLDHPEGVAVGRDGTLYAGGEAGQVYRISREGKSVEVIGSTGGFCLGITLDREENLYICDLGKHVVLRMDQQGRASVVADRVGDRKLVTPNFGVFDSMGNLYFSDSGEWKQADGIVCRLSREGETGLFSAGPFHFANGLALDAAERYLYVAESNLDRVVRIEIRPDGSAGSPEVYAEGLARVPDGLAFDASGNLYVTTYASNCIYRVTPDRRVELVCQDVENLLLCQPTNCAFGGPNFDQLFVANLGRNHISILDLKIKGQPLWCHRA
ncbi:MAG TPA: SMP-30/gluconolactonase/LRE family protein [Terriglobia bacterium]|jgi:gluconolactonase|nr:SMP-30/gluconolactonase/LRE family protein [Terriglobia bacterium]